MFLVVSTFKRGRGPDPYVCDHTTVNADPIRTLQLNVTGMGAPSVAPSSSFAHGGREPRRASLLP
jgi:hypothetical protein